LFEAKRPRWRRYVRFWGANVDADIDDELRYHLELRIDDFVKRGMSLDDARAAALQSFGNPAEIALELRAHDLAQLHRERRADMFQDLMQDVHYGVRQLRSAPRFTFAAIIVLALGIGANTAIFSAIDAVFLKPLPFAAPEQLVSLATAPPFEGGQAIGIGEHRKTEPDLLDHRADTAAFASVAAYATGGLNLAGGAEPIRATVTYATNQFFETFGRAPLVGRAPVAEEYEKGGPKVVTLSYSTWQRLFDGDRRVVGRNVTLNDRTYRVVGVMPADFRFPNNTDAWVTLDMPYGRDVMEAFRNYLPVVGVARLRPGITVQVAAQHLDEIRRRFKPALDKDDTPVAQLARPLQSSLVGDRKTALLVLMASAALLLLIACANVTNLLLARSAVRQREIAVRAVLGATRGRIVRQLVVEHLMLAFAAAAVAVGVARLSLGALSSVVPPTIAGVAPPTIDARVLGFTALVAIATSLLVGVLPALGASRLDLGDAMKQSGAGNNASPRRGRARAILVIAEVSLALMLVVGAGLMIESLRLLLKTDVGIDTSNVASARLVLARAKYNTVERKAEFYAAVLQRLRATPGVQSAGAVNALPLDAVGTISLRIAAEDGPQDNEHAQNAAMLSASSEYFKTLGVQLVGDDLPNTRDTSRHVAVINRTLAQRLWPGQNPIGRRFGWASMQHTVIGVVGDIRTRSLERAAAGQMYTPIVDGPQSYGAIVVRGSSDASHLLADLRNAVRAVDPSQPLYEIRAMDDVVGQSVAPRRTNTFLLGTFGVLAMALAAVGVYAVLSYGVAQRTREIGVRMALGAKREDVIALVAREGLVLAAIGIVIGLAGAFALSKTMSSMLFAVNPRDVRIFAAAPITLAIVAIAATLAPALRATRVDPMSALRAE
jgi:putative ABC transport system permease protein